MASVSSYRAPILLRPRDFQWYVESALLPCDSSSTEEWQKYSDIENEIIEDAYNLKKESVEIDGGYLFNLKRLLQSNGLADSTARRMKRVQLDNDNCRDSSTREERFYSPVTFTSSKTSNSENENEGGRENVTGSSLISSYYYLELSGKKKTIADVVEEAAAGIVKEGREMQRAGDAQWLAEQLLAVKKSGENIQTDISTHVVKLEQDNDPVREDHFSKVPSDIGQTCVNLYTRDSFWYRSLNSVLRVDLHKITREKIKTFGPFCCLLNLYLSAHHTTDTRTVYRGLNLTDAEREQFTSEITTFKSFTSTSKNRKLAELYGNTLLIIDTKVFDDAARYYDGCGTDISTFSQFPQEEEFLITPESLFESAKHEFDSVNDKHIIYLKSMVIVE
jgi:hypothetical protein